MKIGKIRSSKRFREIRAAGENRHGRILKIFFLEKKDPKALNAGIIVPSKTARLAFKRNYVKRAIKGFLLSRREEIKKGGWVVVKLTKPINSLTRGELYEALFKDLENLFRNVGIFGKEAPPRRDKNL